MWLIEDSKIRTASGFAGEETPPAVPGLACMKLSQVLGPSELEMVGTSTLTDWLLPIVWITGYGTVIGSLPRKISAPIRTSQTQLMTWGWRRLTWRHI